MIGCWEYIVEEICHWCASSGSPGRAEVCPGQFQSRRRNYDGLQGTRCKHKRNHANKKENTQTKKKTRK